MPLTRITSQLISIPSNYPLTGSLNGTASYAITSSFAMNGGTGGGGTTLVTGSTYPITSSWSNNSVNSNYSNISISSSFATSATSATSASYSLTSSYSTNAANATSATNATNSTSASYSLTSSYSVNSNTAISSSFASTASYNLNSISSSYALTSSFALNGGGGTTLTTGSTYPITSSWAINAITASYALNSAGGGGGSGGNTQTGSIANQTILYNVTTSQDNVISGLNLSSNKWGVTVVEEWNTGSGDIYYSSSSLLMHFSGSNGSTTFTDSGPNNLTITSNNGAAISTAQSKFDNSSGLFDGTNDYCTISNNSVFDFGAGDFTIEYWEYRTVSTLYKPVLSRNTSGYPPFMVGWSEFGNVNFFSSADGASWNVASAVSMGTITTNVWTHYAVTRNGNTFRTFQNGTQISTFTSTATLPAGAGTLLIGAYATPSYFFQGYIDELRITKGVARYTGSFVTQSIEFPNQLPQYATKYIGLVGGLNDSTVDYGVEKLSDSSLKIRKMTASGQPLSGSGNLSASVDRVYVNVLDYTNVMVTSSYALTASYVLGGIQTGSISNQTILYNVTTSQDNTITGLDLSGNKWDVSVIEEWNSGSGDIYFNSCSLLLHFSGSNNSTTFTDSSANNFTVSVNGNVKITSSISKFESGSGFFDGVGDSLTVPSTSNAAFNPTGGFTVEGWVYFTSNPDFQFIVSSAQGVGSFESYWFVGTSSGGNWRVSYGNASAVDTGVAIVFNTWTHFALSCTSTNARLFVNGIQIGTATVTQQNANMNLIIGAYAGGSLYYFNGYLDELRFTKGISRYTSSFVTQSVQFPDSLPQYETKYIGLVGGLNDTGSDYGVQKLSDTSLKIRKMSVSGTPVSGSPVLSASVDRVYVNVLNYKNVQTTTQSASYALSASYTSGGGGTTLVTGSTYPITSSWSNNVITASYALNAGSGGGSTSLTGITFPYVSGSNTYVLSQSAVAANDLLLSVNGVVQTPTTDYTVSSSSVTFTDSYPSGSSVNVRYLVSATSSSFVDLNNIVLTGTTTGDAYYPQVAALLHFDGVNGSTTITDNSKNNLAVTATNGAAISTAQSKFGGASCFFDGTNDYLSIPDNSAFDFVASDFTIECWLYPTSHPTTVYLLGQSSNTDYAPVLLYLFNGRPGIAASTNGSAWVINNYIASALTLNTWSHLALVRYGNKWSVYVNGTENVIAASTSATLYNSTDPFGIGGEAAGSLTFPYAGYLDELRITNGYARYTGNFTPSTTAFSNTGGDVGKALVVNSTATGVSIGTAGYLSSQLAKAWVNFNGTGTVAIRDSYNVSSITDNGVGDYTINYSTALNNSNYAISGITDYNESGLHRVIVYRAGLSHQYNTLGVRIQIIGQVGSSDGTQDPAFASLMVLGN